MSGFIKKFTSVALIVALVFFMFPVNTGVREFDNVTHEKAEAVLPIAPVVIVASALAAGGILIAGASSSTYNANLDSVYQGMKNGTSHWSTAWAQYCEDKGGFDNAINSALTVDGQNINLEVLKDAGFFDSARSYSVWCVNNGTAVSGSSSSDAFKSYLDLSGYSFGMIGNYDEAPLFMQYGYSTWPANTSYKYFVGYQIVPNGTYSTYYRYYFNNEPTLNWTVVDSSTIQPSTSIMRVEVNVQINSTTGEVKKLNSSYRNYKDNFVSGDPATFLSNQVEHVLGENNAQIGNTTTDLAVVDPAVIEGTQTWPEQTVAPFVPTDSQLQSGYSFADVPPATTVEPGEPVVVDQNVGAISTAVGTIATTLNTLNNVMGLTNDYLSNISFRMNWLQNTPFSWLASWWQSLTGWWDSLLSMLGDTPLAQLLAPVSGVLTWLNTDLASWLGTTSISDLFSNVTSGMAGWATEIMKPLDATAQWLTTDLGNWLGSAPINQLFAGVTSGITGLAADFAYANNIFDDIAAWIGSTPIGTLIGTVTTGISNGVGTIADGISTGVGTITQSVNDVNSWLGTLSGWWEGLNSWAGIDGATTLEGVLDGVLSGTLGGILEGVISGTLAGTLADVFGGTLADVIEAIQAAAIDLATSIDGIMEGVTFPEFNFPKPSEEQGTETLDAALLPNNPMEGVGTSLRNKAPFAYVIALAETMASVSAWNSTPTFYVDYELPFAGVQRFDAGTWLNYDVHGITVAMMIRALVTMAICVMIVNFAYKTTKMQGF